MIQAIPLEEEAHAAAMKVQAYHRAETARKCYRAATALVVATLLLALAPFFDAWIWPVVGCVSVAVTVLGGITIAKGEIGNGLISLLFAWIILPGWILAVPMLRPVAMAGIKSATSKTAAQRIAEGEMAKPITPSPDDGSIQEAKDWIQNAVIHGDAVQYQKWSTAQQGEQFSSVVEFTTVNNHGEPVHERLKFVFNRFEKQPVSVFNQKTGNFLFERSQTPPRNAP